MDGAVNTTWSALNLRWSEKLTTWETDIEKIWAEKKDTKTEGQIHEVQDTNLTKAVQKLELGYRKNQVDGEKAIKKEAYTFTWRRDTDPTV